uniref:EscU/YscU/HrcU family type III secretion system export apparatus switch protein n=1 Tax=Sphingomonas sp. TaxID=28214 RepID=UPI0025EF0D89
RLGDFSASSDPSQLLPMFAQGWSLLLAIILTLGAALLLIIVPLEIFQLRGLSFSAHPLKPDFKRLNPALGFKRLFSMKMLKEAAKNIIKFAIYVAVSAVAISAAVDRVRAGLDGGREMASVLWSESLSLTAMFVAAALVIAAIDQFIARREFSKQMRMSRSELTRENKEREGEPRIKAKRKQLHAEFVKQTEGLGKLAGSDLIVVNPEHFAIALAYDASRMNAPEVRAKGRNQLALAMKRRAAMLGIPVISDPPLARVLFRSSTAGREIAADHYRDVARLYSQLRTQQQPMRDGDA